MDLFFKGILLFSTLFVQAPEKAIVEKVPNDWYQSTSNLFEYCVDVRFAHPICPQINRTAFGDFNFRSDFFRAPTGPLSAKSLFQATVLYQVNRAPNFWLVGLKLDQERPKNIDARLWAEAQLLWAQVLHDKGQIQEPLKVYDKLVDEFKGRGLFHQQRAWVQFKSKQFDKALGSIVSAESPLIYPVPFFDKWFLRALVEKETCNYKASIDTIGNGRRYLSTTPADPEVHPWVVLCERKNLGTTCRRLKTWYKRVYEKKVKMALDDLDLLEIEIRDRLTPGQKKASTSKIRWPYAGENWKDELGHYSVPIESSCS